MAADAVPCGGDGNAAPHVAASALRAAALRALPPPPPPSPVRGAARAEPTPAAAAASPPSERIRRREQNHLDRRFASLDGRKLSPSLFRFHRRGIFTE